MSWLTFAVGVLFFLSGPLGAWGGAGWTFTPFPASQLLYLPGAYLVLLTLRHPWSLRAFLVVPCMFPLFFYNVAYRHGNNFIPEGLSALVPFAAFLKVPVSCVTIHWIGTVTEGLVLGGMCLHALFTMHDSAQLSDRAWLVLRIFGFFHTIVLWTLLLEVPRLILTGTPQGVHTPWVWLCATVLVTPEVRKVLQDGVCRGAGSKAPMM